MKCVVPLAGPDLWTPERGLRPLLPFDGQPLLSRVLERRPWRHALRPEDYIFVVRDIETLPELVAVLEATWPGHRRVVLSDLTGGAMLSALAGLALCDATQPIVVDLADILFERMAGDLAGLLSGGDAPRMVVPVFDADDPCYSYLEIADQRVVRAVEKQVISCHASAGVYAFASAAQYLDAAAWCLSHAEAMTVRGIHFVCPMVNGILAAGHRVVAIPVFDALPLSKSFHMEIGREDP